MSPRPDALPGQEHFVAPADEVPLRAVDAVDTESEPRSLWGEAWHSLIRNPVFVISGVLIAFILLVTLFPSLFTSQDPRYCVLANSYGGPQAGHRSEEHTSELQSRGQLVCRLLLEKNK